MTHRDNGLPDSPIAGSLRELDGESATTDCSCSHEGRTYAKGGKFCKDKVEYECGCKDGAGAWFKNGKSC